MAGRNFIVLLKNVFFFFPKTWTLEKASEILGCPNSIFSTKFSQITSNDFMVAFCSVIGCKRSLEVTVKHLML